jgi:hypothetical protein
MSFQFWLYITLTVVSVGGLIFGVFVFKNLIKDAASEQAVLKPDNHDLWGNFPGKSGILLHKYHWFYNFTNTKDFITADSKPVMQEQGPYNVFENQEFMNPIYNNNTDTITYKLYRYFNLSTQDAEKQANESIVTLNLVFYYLR